MTQLISGATKTSRSRLPAGGKILSRKSDRPNRFRRQNFSSKNLQSSQGRQEGRRAEKGVDRSPEEFQPVHDCPGVPPGLNSLTFFCRILNFFFLNLSYTCSPCLII